MRAPRALSQTPSGITGSARAPLLRWTRGWTIGPTGFERLRVRGQPNVDVILAKNLPGDLEEAGARIEIRVSPEHTRLFAWEDKDSSAATEIVPSESRAKERAEAVVAEMLARLRARKGQSGYR